MITRETIFKSGDTDKIWKRFCGFLDLSLDEFMSIQRQLLEEQIEVMQDSPLWKKLLNGKKPKTLEEFREMAPLTTYWTHYAQYIGQEGKTDFLLEKPLAWAHTSGRGGQFKWIPWTTRGLEKSADAAMAGVILSAANMKGDMNVSGSETYLTVLPPSPYISGTLARVLMERFNMKIIPPLDVSDKLEFQERIQLGFKMALETGADFVGAVTTVLVKAGEGMAERSASIKVSPFMMKPQVLMRTLRALFVSRREKRPMLPRDLWHVKGITTGGTDTSIYRDALLHYWGKVAHESYSASETGIMMTQSWDKRRDMTFYPYMVFMEFIPEEEWLKSKSDPAYQPRTVLMDELHAGVVYEIVITNFNGMSLMRYRLGDLIKVTALEDKVTGIKLPQAIFVSRADGLIDLYGVVRLDERTLWQAMDSAKVPYEDWTARKEYEGANPVLRIYVEPKPGAGLQPGTVAESIHTYLRAMCPPYEEAFQEMRTNPVRIVPIPAGSFQSFYDLKKKQGVDLAHLKPPHMNAPDDSIVELAGKKTGD